MWCEIKNTFACSHEEPARLSLMLQDLFKFKLVAPVPASQSCPCPWAEAQLWWPEIRSISLESTTVLVCPRIGNIQKPIGSDFGKYPWTLWIPFYITFIHFPVFPCWRWNCHNYNTITSFPTSDVSTPILIVATTNPCFHDWCMFIACHICSFCN